MARKILQRGGWYEPLHGDLVLRAVVDEIVQTCGISTFVETGTFVGDTTRYIASRHPELRVLTCEISPRWLALAKRLCRGIDNIEFFQGSSTTFLQRKRDGLSSAKPLFWLDAHWGDYWPLPDETRIISTLPAYAVFIDDFEVPDRPSFHYDSYHGVKNCLAIQREILGSTCLVPNYEPDESCKNLVGYGLFVKNLDLSGIDAIKSLRLLAE